MNTENLTEFYIEKYQPVREAISSLAVRVMEYKTKYGRKCIVLTGCAASNGTTMVSINLAAALSRSGAKTLLIDADMRTQKKHENRMADLGLHDVILGHVSEDAVIKKTNIDGLYFMPSGDCTPDPALLLCSDAAAALIRRVSSSYDFVLFDSPAVTVVPETAALFMNVDGILLICALDKTTKKQLKSAKTLIEPYSDKYYGLAVNSVDEGQYRRLFPNHNYYPTKHGKIKMKK
jgi:capsular exopolysaccharide synthesis family protein